MEDWLNDFLRRMNEVAQGRLPILQNTTGLNFDLKDNPEYLCEICLRREIYEGGQK